MTVEIAICLAILAAAVLLFAWDLVPADVVALGVLLAVIATGLLPADKAVAGFASDTVIMILGLLIMTAGLMQTGIVESVGRHVLELAGRNPTAFLPLIMVSAAAVSAFISNTAATALFIPLILGYADRTGVSPSQYLLPVAFASILSSSVTLISTSTNLVVSDFLARAGQAPMGMLELTPVGLPIAAAGLVYMMLVGVKLIPRRRDQTAEEKIGERKYQADVVVEPGGPLVGKSVREAAITPKAGLSIAKVLRGGETLPVPTGADDLQLQAGDELVIEGLRADLLKIKSIEGLDFKADAHLADPDAEQEEQTIVEGVLLPRSPLIGNTLRRLDFKDRYGLQVLALHRGGDRVPRPISAVRLRLGDVLLLQGTRKNVRALERGNLFNIFGGVEASRLNPSRAPVAAGIFALVILAVTFKAATLPVAALAGAFLMLLTRCLAPEQAYAQVEWKAIILIGALLSLGAAMEATGTGQYLARQLIALMGTGYYSLMTCFFVLTIALTQPMSNQAAAVVVLPIALQTGVELGVDPRGFIMMVAVAASCSFLTPLEPSCLMVYGPGKYRFWDFVKVGAPLTVIVYLVAILLVPWVWPTG